MESYLIPIKTAILVFPFIAFLFTIPYILYQYHKYGSIYWLRVGIIYSFLLYLLAAYFLVILPLPPIEEVRNYVTPRTQLIPFDFVMDFVQNTSLRLNDFSTYLSAVKEPYFYIFFYNILLCLPFGVYLHYYFRCSLKKTIFLTFLLSLFFELTQLSGLYFIYPRGYRLFDVDDLLLNTFGGFIGYYVGSLFVKFLPTREQLDTKSYQLGTKISWLRRITLFVLDIFIYSFINSIITSIFSSNFKVLSLLVLFTYYIIFPYFMKGQTLGGKFLNVKIVSMKEKLTFVQILIRQTLFYGIYFISPIVVSTFLTILLSLNLSIIFFFVVLLCIFFYFYLYFISFIKALFMKKDLFYDKISKTKLASSIQVDE